MKLTSILTGFLLFFASLSFAQNFNADVVYLKNGSIIRGVIIEQVPNQSLKIQTQDKSVFVYRYEEIEKITKELTQQEQIMPKRKPNPIIKTDSSFSTAHRGRFFFNANIGYGLSAAPQLLDFNVNNAINLGVGVYGIYGKGFVTKILLGSRLK